MSRKADCYDNAPMESFFHTLKAEFVHRCQYATRQQAKRSAIGYISRIKMDAKSSLTLFTFLGEDHFALRLFSLS